MPTFCARGAADRNKPCEQARSASKLLDAVSYLMPLAADAQIGINLFLI